MISMGIQWSRSLVSLRLGKVRTLITMHDAYITRNLDQHLPTTVQDDRAMKHCDSS